MVVIDTYEIEWETRREWWTKKIGEELKLEGKTTELKAKSAKTIKTFLQHGRKMCLVEVVYW